MKILRKAISSSNFWPVLIVIIFAILAGRSLIFQQGYFNMHDDLQMMRQLEMEKCFLDGQIPCRWVPDMGYGFGFPLFNFYPPLPYLIGEIFRILGFSFVMTIKLVFALSIIVSGITMYLLAKEFFGRIGAILSAAFYIWAPYHAVDVYVRGAMNEAWALAWFPLIFWTTYRLIKEKKNLTKWIIALSLSWSALFTSHNLMVLIFAPVFAGWVLLLLWQEKKWRLIPQFVLSGILAFGLAAFFTLPVLLEKNLVQVDTLVVGYYEYTAHFATLKQMFISRFWGYGPSVWGTEDGMPFQIGHLHWGLSLVAGSIILAIIFRKRKKAFTKLAKTPFLLPGLYLFAVGWFSAFMAHSRSTPIWQMLPPLKFVQFPWRFLTITTFAFSFLAGAVVALIKNKKSLFLVAAGLVLAVLVLNWHYFRPEKGRMGPLTDEEKFSGAAWELQQTAGIYDYLPKAAKEAPKGPQTVLAEIMQGEGEISKAKQGTYWAKFNIKVKSPQARVRINIFDFPNWKISIDDRKVEPFVAEDERWGRMYIEVPQGEHLVYLQLYNTFPRTLGNLISLITWAGLLTYSWWRKQIG